MLPPIAAAALRGLCARTRCKPHASTGGGYCWFESLAVAFTTAGTNFAAFVAALEHTVHGARGRAAQLAASARL